MEQDWWVYSTVTEGRAILVKNRKTGERGSIDDPTDAEWAKAFRAPSRNYPWDDPARINVDPSTVPGSVTPAN
jgi:hypothetical protein